MAKLLVLGLVEFVVETWAVMLLIGAAHAHAPAIPALSYGATAFMVGAAHVLLMGTNVNIARQHD